MSVTVNKNTLSILVKDSKSNEDIICFLNSVIDEELEKENPDCDLIDECVNALAAVEENDDAAPVVHIAVSPSSIKKIVDPHRTSWNNLNRAVRVAIIAAVIATGAISVNAAVDSATGVNIIKEIASAVTQIFSDTDDEKQTAEPKAQITDKATGPSDTQTETADDEKITPEPQTQSASVGKTPQNAIQNQSQSQETDAAPTVDNTIKKEPKTEDKPLITQPSESYAPSLDNGKKPDKNNSSSDDTAAPEFRGVEAQYGTMKRNLIVGESLDYTGMNVYALYSDGSKRQVSLDDCTYPKAFDSSVVGDYTLNVQYKSAVFTFGVTVRPDEETRYSTICSNDDYDYLLTDRGAYAVKYKGTSNKITLDSVDGNSVYALSSSMFKDSEIKEFSSSTVQKLYDGVFKDCENLEKCNLPNCSVVGDKAFSGCENLFDFTLADTLTSIGEASFEKSGISSVTLGENITSVPDFAFSECQNLTSVELLGKVTKIGNNAFAECSSLLSVDGTAYITKVGDFGFYSCEFMEFDSQPARLRSVGNCGFASCKSVDLGELYGLTSIGIQAFQYCSNIDSVCISEDVKSVPNAAFQGAHIKTLVIEEGVEAVEPYAFMSTLITELDLPQSLKTIGTYAFYTSALRTVKGGNNVTSVGSRAFYPSKRLTVYADSDNALADYCRSNNIHCIVGNKGEEQEV